MESRCRFEIFRLSLVARLRDYWAWGVAVFANCRRIRLCGYLDAAAPEGVGAMRRQPPAVDADVRTPLGDVGAWTCVEHRHDLVASVRDLASSVLPLLPLAGQSISAPAPLSRLRGCSQDVMRVFMQQAA